MKTYHLTDDMRDAIEHLAKLGDVINGGWCNEREADVIREYSHLCNTFMFFLLGQMWEDKE